MKSSLSAQRDRYSDTLLGKIETILAHVTDADLLLQPLLDPSVVVVPRASDRGPDFSIGFSFRHSVTIGWL